MKALVVILAGLYGAWHFTDLSSPDALNSVVAPFAVFIFLVALMLWLVLKGGFAGKAERGGLLGDNDGSFGGDGGGGDGGG